MKRLLFTLSILIAIALAPRAAHAELEVVATVPTLAALARELGGEHVHVESLSLPTQDPHFVDAKPSLALKLNKANLLLAVGLGLESGWLPVLQKGARNAAILDGSRGYLEAATFVRRLEVPASLDRSDGDVHAGGNPHFLYDPRRLKLVAMGVSSRLGALDPEHLDGYNRRLAKFLEGLRATSEKLDERMKPYRGTAIIGYHKSWVYLTDWLGLEEVAALEPKPGIPPSSAHVAKVLAIARQKQARALLQEVFYPSATAELVAEKSGARVVLVPGGADFRAGQTVAAHLTELCDKLEQGLRR